MTSPDSLALNDLTDSDAVRAALDGNDAAYTLLMRRYKGPLYRYALRHLGDADDAEDAVQDAFIAAHNNLHRFKPHLRFSTWMYRITLNKCRDIGRKRKARAFMQRMSSFVENTAPADEASHSPEALHQSRSQLDQLQTRIARLPDSLKPAFVLCVMQEKSHKEASQILHLSPKAIEVRVYRARQILRAGLDDED